MTLQSRLKAAGVVQAALGCHVRPVVLTSAHQTACSGCCSCHSACDPLQAKPRRGLQHHRGLHHCLRYWQSRRGRNAALAVVAALSPHHFHSHARRCGRTEDQDQRHRGCGNQSRMPALVLARAPAAGTRPHGCAGNHGTLNTETRSTEHWSTEHGTLEHWSTERRTVEGKVRAGTYISMIDAIATGGLRVPSQLEAALTGCPQPTNLHSMAQ